MHTVNGKLQAAHRAWQGKMVWGIGGQVWQWKGHHWGRSNTRDISAMSQTHCQEFSCTPPGQLSRARGGLRGRRAPTALVLTVSLAHFPLIQPTCDVQPHSLSLFFSSPLPTVWRKWTRGAMNCVRQGTLINQAFLRASLGEIKVIRLIATVQHKSRDMAMTRADLPNGEKKVSLERNPNFQIYSSYFWYWDFFSIKQATTSNGLFYSALTHRQATLCARFTWKQSINKI